MEIWRRSQPLVAPVMLRIRSASSAVVCNPAFRRA
uniref:S-adenosyl-methyltransferase mraw n=1 Tax=Rhizophora mucronata TaxID=61149 RepID=A0A2P2JAT5_RHIMU